MTRICETCRDVALVSESREIHTTSLAEECPICKAPPSQTVHMRMERGFYQLMRCESCTAVYLDPRPTPAAIRALYESASYYNNGSGTHGYLDYEEGANGYRKTGLSRLRYVSPFLDLGRARRGPRLLEIGAAFGYFIEAAKQEGYPVAALEIAPEAIQRLRQICRVFEGDIGIHGFSEAFESIAAFDVIEHLLDQHTFLDQVAEALVPGGIFLVNIPDIESWVARVLGKRWWTYKVPEHLVYLTRRSFVRLIEGRFEVLAERPDFQYAPVSVLTDNLGRWHPALKAVAGRISRALRLGNAMFPIPNGLRLYVLRRL